MNRRWHGLRGIIAVLVGVALGVTSAGAVGKISEGPAAADLIPGPHTGTYSYSDSNCWNPVDPISVVFYYEATTGRVNDHSYYHGNWSYTGGAGSDQYFYDHWCEVFDDDAASASALQTRYHHRFHQGNYWDPTYGTYSLSTPHFEDIVPCPVLPGHAVRENGSASMPEGGFVHAKWDIGWNWHHWTQANDPHYFLGSQNWGNTARREQCDGGVAWNDGYVDFVRVRAVDS